MGPRVLVADCRDSFVYTIVDYLRVLGADVTVVRADELDPNDVDSCNVNGIVLSPGPGAPVDATTCHELLRLFAGVVPILGVCLGHQVIAQHYGASVIRAPYPCHGETATITHDEAGIFTELPNPMTVTRYHSLMVSDFSVLPELSVTARDESEIIMAVRHRTLAIEGIQFHPESVTSEHGKDLFRNWLTSLKTRQETNTTKIDSLVTGPEPTRDKLNKLVPQQVRQATPCR